MFRKPKIKANLRKKTLEEDFNVTSIEDEQKEIEFVFFYFNFIGPYIFVFIVVNK